jgi:hypothetical protein
MASCRRCGFGQGRWGWTSSPAEPRAFTLQTLISIPARLSLRSERPSAHAQRRLVRGRPTVAYVLLAAFAPWVGFGH